MSELLQSQLLQPININPVQPHLAESNLFTLSGAGLGPSDLSFNEFNPLFNRNRLALQASGIAGTQDTLGEEVVQSGVWGPLSYSVGQFHYQTDGFRKNNDFKENIYNIFVQGSLSYKTSLQAELRLTDLKSGDRSLNFFPQDFIPTQRNKEENTSIRLGFHHAFGPSSDLIGSITYKDLTDKYHDELFGSIYDWNIDADGYCGELQYLFRAEHLNVVGGGGYFDIDQKDVTLYVIPSIFTLYETKKTDIRHTNLYLYSQIHYPKNVTITIGASGDFFRGGVVDRNQFNPKLGITWNPFTGTTLRAALFKTFKRTLITNQTLEPTQVAGFNQFFDDAEATKSWRYGLAIDQKFSRNLYGGVEFSKRDLVEVPFELTIPTGTSVLKVDWEEYLGRTYLYWTPYPWLGVSGEYQYEKFDRGKIFTAGVHYVRTHRVPLGINFYHPSGFSAKLKVTYVNQKGKFQPQGSPMGSFESGEDQFWVFDASITYRFPKRYGIITLGAKNLFDRSFSYQDMDPVNPLMQPKRLIYGKFTLAF